MSDAAQEAEAQVDEKTAIQNNILEIFAAGTFSTTMHLSCLRGSGTVVQIDESLFCHKCKV